MPKLKALDVCFAAGWTLGFVPENFENLNIQQDSEALQSVAEKFKASKLCLTAIQKYAESLLSVVQRDKEIFQLLLGKFV